MSVSVLERLDPRIAELEHTIPEAARPPVQPGVVCIPYETSNEMPKELTPHKQLLALKAQLEAEGVYATLSFHRTQETFAFVEDTSERGHHFEPTNSNQRFALFTLEGVGEPTQAALASLTASDGLYPNETIIFGGEVYHSRFFTNNPTSRPPESASAVLLGTNVDKLQDMLTGFQNTLTAEQTTQWGRLQGEADEIADRLRLMQSPADRDSNVEHIKKVRAELAEKQQETRDFLEGAVPADHNTATLRKREASEILVHVPEPVNTGDTWTRLRDMYQNNVSMGTLRAVHDIYKEVASLEVLGRIWGARYAAQYPDGWPKDVATKQAALMDRIATLNDRARALLEAGGKLMTADLLAKTAQPDRAPEATTPKPEAETPARRARRGLGWLALIGRRRRANA